jgi:hypothetical protein
MKQAIENDSDLAGEIGQDQDEEEDSNQIENN